MKIALAYLLYRGSLFLRFAIRVGLAKTYKTIVGQLLGWVDIGPGFLKDATPMGVDQDVEAAHGAHGQPIPRVSAPRSARQSTSRQPA